MARVSVWIHMQIDTALDLHRIQIGTWIETFALNLNLEMNPELESDLHLYLDPNPDAYPVPYPKMLPQRPL